ALDRGHLWFFALRRPGSRYFFCEDRYVARVVFHPLSVGHLYPSEPYCLVLEFISLALQLQGSHLSAIRTGVSVSAEGISVPPQPLMDSSQQFDGGGMSSCEKQNLR